MFYCITSFVEVHQSKTGGIPELVYKMAVPFNTLFRHLDVSALGSEGGQGKTEGIGSILLYNR